MKRIVPFGASLVLFLILGANVSTAFAQGTAFTYQGRLNDGLAPANGSYDLAFALFKLSSGPPQINNTITNSAVSVSNGLFAVTLDFGANFPGTDRWLEIAVRTNGGGPFVSLSPRQKLSAAPYAITAGGVSGPIADSQLSGNIARLNGNSVFTGTVVFSNSANQFAGGGAGLTNLNLTLNSSGAFTPNAGTFVLSSSLNIGSNPRSVVAVDVNGDGRVDVITANSGDGTLPVLTNDGHGGFVLDSSLIVGSYVYAATAADVNGDGKMDLIEAGATLSIFTNNGSGGFALSSSSPASAQDITTADVNGDGWADLIMLDVSDTVIVLTNNRSGGFVLSSSYSVGHEPWAVISADVNGDGKPDVITANYLGHSLTILTNNGSGGFVLASTPGGEAGPHGVTAADINGDGKMDLISADTDGNQLFLLTNNGSGGFALSATLSTGAGSFPESVAAADINGDGKPDLISANSGSNTLTIFTNNGAGGFALASAPVVGIRPVSVTAADVNGDGRMDLLCANFDSGTVSVLLNPAFNLFGNLNAADLTGTIADARLSANVALRAGGNTFTGTQTVSGGSLGIGTSQTPLGGLRVHSGGLAVTGQSSPNYGTAQGVFLEGTSSFGLIYAFDYAAFQPKPLSLNNSGGNVGIGTITPGFTLEVNGSAGKPGGGTWSATSDARVKKNIEPLHGALAKLAQLRGVSFEWVHPADHANQTGRQGGFVAQEVERVFPGWVQPVAAGEHDRALTADGKIKSLTLPFEFDALLVEAIREQQQQLQARDAEIAELKSAVAELRALLVESPSHLSRNQR